MVNGVPSGYQETGPSYLDILTGVTINRFDSGSRSTGLIFSTSWNPLAGTTHGKVKEFVPR
jgi:hypothetical protein